MSWLSYLHGELFGTPSEYWDDYSIEFMIRCEATHFLFSAFSGYVAFLLMWTILSGGTSQWSDRYIFFTSLFFGLSISATIHLLIDVLTQLA